MSKLIDWFDEICPETIVLGYGSLMNQSSRETYNNINSLCLPVKVHGWKREWVTRSVAEQQTYVGAIQAQNSVINAQAVPSVIDQMLLKREVDYRFVEIQPDSVQFTREVCPEIRQKINNSNIYICESLLIEAPTKKFPVYQSYLDTCLAGCIEVGGEMEATAFMRSTSGWPSFGVIDDRAAPRYPRVGHISKESYEIIDSVLSEYE